MRVDRNPLDITKLVAVQPIASQSGDLCDTLGDPVTLTFGYIPGTTVMTGQDSGKARILFQGPVDNDGTSFIVVSDEDDASKALSGDGDQYFRGNVDIGDTFAASENFAGDNFGSKTFVHFFENQNGELLQSIEYHTSCSQEIRLGDVIGNATLFGYDGKDGSLSIPGPQFVDANQAPGPETLVGNDVDFRYEVRNTGNSPISGVTVTDDRLDNVTFVEGDNNNNNQLDVNEVWIYEASETAGLGLQTNKGTATGIFGGQKFMAMDLANYTGIETPSSPSVIPPTPNPGNGNGIIFEVDDPFDPNNIGEDANSPTGPVAELNDKITFTYRVTNPGSVTFEITSNLDGVFGPIDDNKTPDDPTDDFVPAPVLKAKGTNFGDDNANGLVDSGEEWYFQAMEFADEGGQQTNDSKVVAEDSEGNMVMDTDPANYLVNPLNLEKLVAVEQMVEGGDVCETAGKPESLTFTYLPSLIIDTNQKPGQVQFKNNPTLDNDGEVYIETNKGFSGTVEIGEEFTVFATGGDLTFKIYDFQGGPLLQDIEKYHLSCSQDITLGDQLGSVTLTGYTGEDGSVTIPTPVFVDADNPPGPEAIIGTTVNFRYEVTNTGTEPLSNVNVTDDKLNPEAIEEGGFNVGDVNQDNFLDVDEKWLFAGSEIANEGLQTNKGTATAKLDGTDLMDMDPANYTGIEKPVPSGDVCDILGKPRALTFEYSPGTDVLTGQDSNKAFAEGTPDFDGESYIVVSKEDKLKDVFELEDKDTFFAGTVPEGEDFTAMGEKFGSQTNFFIFDDQAAFSSGSNPLQTLGYHTSCSQPIRLGDIIGSVELVGYVGEDGSAGSVFS